MVNGTAVGYSKWGHTPPDEIGVQLWSILGLTTEGISGNHGLEGLSQVCFVHQLHPFLGQETLVTSWLTAMHFTWVALEEHLKAMVCPENSTFHNMHM